MGLYAIEPFVSGFLHNIFLRFIYVVACITTSSLFLFLKICLIFGCAIFLCCFTQAFSCCSESGLLLVAVLRLLIAVAPLVAEQGLKVCGL